MKKLLLLSILLLSIYSCKKDDDITEPIIEVPILVNPVNGVIEIIEGIDINSVIIQNGSVKKSILEEDFEIDALTDISSAQDNQGNIIYLHSKYLSPSTAQNKSAKNKNSSASIKLTPEETARALLFNSLGLHYISNDSKFYENIGKIIELDGTLAPLFNQLVTAIENDIETNGYLTSLTYQSNILTTYNDAFRTALDISSTILNWPSEIFDLIEPDEQEYDVANAPYFLINDNGTPKRSNKIASFHGGCIIEIKSANKLTDGSWDLQLDYYNKFPGVKYVTEMYFDNNGNRVYSKESLKNIIKPYNSSELYSDLTSLATVKDIFVEFADIASNGILASDWHTTQATKNEIELNISNSNNNLLVGNVWENNDLLFYSMVEIVGKTMGLMSTIDKIGSKKEDDDSKKDLLKKFVNHLKDPSNRVGEKILKNILLIKDKSGNLNALNTHIKELAIDLSTEFLEWISSEVGKAALQIYIDKEKTTLVGNVELNQLKFVEEVFSVVKNKDITLNNAINVLSDKFPFFKAVNTGLKIGTVAQDIAIFFFNMKTPVLHRQIYLPFESEILPENGSTVDIGTEFSIDFSTEIELTTDNSKKIKIIEHNSNNVIKEISLNQLTIDNTIKKLLFTPTGLNLNTQYYITIPEGLVFNSTGATFQGIFTNDIWSFTTSDSHKNITFSSEELSIINQNSITNTTNIQDNYLNTRFKSNGNIIYPKENIIYEVNTTSFSENELFTHNDLNTIHTLDITSDDNIWYFGTGGTYNPSSGTLSLSGTYRLSNNSSERLISYSYCNFSSSSYKLLVNEDKVFLYNNRCRKLFKYNKSSNNLDELTTNIGSSNGASFAIYNSTKNEIWQRYHWISNYWFYSSNLSTSSFESIPTRFIPSRKYTFDFNDNNEKIIYLNSSNSSFNFYELNLSNNENNIVDFQSINFNLDFIYCINKSPNKTLWSLVKSDNTNYLIKIINNEYILYKINDDINVTSAKLSFSPTDNRVWIIGANGNSTTISKLNINWN